MIVFSAQTIGFYDISINADIPADAVEISDSEHAALMAAQSAGRIVVADADGRPVAVDRPVTPPTVAAVKAEAARRITASGLPWMVEREVSGGAPIPQTIKDYAADVRSASGEIESTNPIPADYADDRHWPEMPDLADGDVQ